jgi:hypothetical protein
MQRKYAFTVINQIPLLPETKAQVLKMPNGEGWVLKFVTPFNLPAGNVGAMFVWARGDLEASGDSLSDFLSSGRR